MTEVKFNSNNWFEYYNAKLDTEDLNDVLEESNVGSLHEVRSISANELAIDIINIFKYEGEYFEFEDAETGDIIKVYETDVSADYSFTAVYTIDIEDFDSCNEVLKEAIDNDQDKFEIEFRARVKDVTNVEVYNIEHDVDDDTIIRIGGESVFEKAMQEMIEWQLSETEINTSNMIERPKDVVLKFVCTIPVK